MTTRPIEREPLGITYDRLRLHELFRGLISKYPIKTVLELPAGGSKAMPSLYSLALAHLGAEVWLLNPDPQGLIVWDRLGMPYHSLEAEDLRQTGLEERSFDLVWNFVTLGFDPDFESIIGEMARLSSRYVMTVHCNGFNYGYPWHRFLHRLLALEWNHGERAYFFPKNVRRCYRSGGLEPIEFGLFDMPWWPDPPGFRDVRLHLNPVEQVEDFQWSAPIEEIYSRGKIPLPLRLLSWIEDGPIPNLVRYPFSHLFYFLGTRQELFDSISFSV